jgi:hypothetical protein
MKATRNEHAILTKDNFQKKIFHKMGGQFAILCAMLLGNIAPKIFLLIPAVIGLFMAQKHKPAELVDPYLFSTGPSELQPHTQSKMWNQCLWILHLLADPLCTSLPSLLYPAHVVQR